MEPKKNSIIYDVAIVGGGPAGVTAAIYAARKKLNTLLLSSNIGGQMVWSSDVQNYPGINSLSGVKLSERFDEHLESFDIEKDMECSVVSIEKSEKNFIISTCSTKYGAKTAIIATGRKPKSLNVPGEKEFQGRGIAYCATCDAPLFAGRDVAIIGGGNSALDAAMQFLNIANKVYLISKTEITGDKIMQEKVSASSKAEIITGAEVIAILGEKTVKAIKIKKDGKEKDIAVKGIFIEIGYVPTIPMIKGAKLALNEIGEIKVDGRCATNIKGLFAAGDVTDVPYKQIVIAAGQGSIASIAAFEYLSKNDTKG